MNSAKWSRTSWRVDRPALTAATDHKQARFGIQLSCVTPAAKWVEDAVCLSLLYAAGGVLCG